MEIQNGIVAKSATLIIAPMDFVMDGKEFFTFDERFLFARYFPKGWRPLTTVEADSIIFEFFKKEGDPNERFLQKLGFALTGYIYPGMDQYNKNLSNNAVLQDLIQKSHLEARYWVDGPSSENFAPALCLRRFKRPKVENFARGVGCKIRLVQPIKSP